MIEQRIQQHFFDSADLLNQTAETLARPLAEAAAALVGAITGGGKVVVAAPDPAAALAAHFASRLVGRFERERPPLAAIALDAEAARAEQQLRALGQPGDALVLLDAGDDDAGATARRFVEAAHDKEMTVVAIAGAATAQALADVLAETDVHVAVPHERAARVAEIQLLALHCLCDAIDSQLLGDIES